MKYLNGYEGIKVLGARVVIKLQNPEEKTPSGIILVPGTEEPKFEGLVVAVGPGARNNKGETMPMDVNPGDWVIYSRMAGVPIEHKGEKFLIINERDVIAITAQQ